MNVKYLVAAGRTGAGRPRAITDPAPTITGKGTAYWLADRSEYGRRLSGERSDQSDD